MVLPTYNAITQEEKEKLGKEHYGIKKALEFRTFKRVYETPFIYENVEMGNVSEIDVCKGNEFYADKGFLTITEDKPIVSVTVVGSGCTRGGYNIVEWWEEGESIDDMHHLQLVKRQYQGNLNGMHPSVWIEIMRKAAWTNNLFEGKPINQPNISDGVYADNVEMMKYQTNGFINPFEVSLYENTAHFRIGTAGTVVPMPKKVTIRCGCKGIEDPGTDIERYPADYAIRLVEVEVMDV